MSPVSRPANRRAPGEWLIVPLIVGALVLSSCSLWGDPAANGAVNDAHTATPSAAAPAQSQPVDQFQLPAQIARARGTITSAVGQLGDALQGALSGAATGTAGQAGTGQPAAGQTGSAPTTQTSSATQRADRTQPTPTPGIIFSAPDTLAPNGVGISTGQTPATRAGGSAADSDTVSVVVMRDSAGAVQILVPVYINGQGPFSFALDTGASVSVIDAPLVQQLGLKQSRRGQQAVGVSGTVRAHTLTVDDWQLGQITLDPATVASIDMPDSTHLDGIQGLLGSDVLSRFGTITIDYTTGKLLLHHKG